MKGLIVMVSDLEGLSIIKVEVEVETFLHQQSSLSCACNLLLHCSRIQRNGAHIGHDFNWFYSFFKQRNVLI